MPRSAPVTELPPIFAKEEQRGDGGVASLNPDGSKRWFIPPYVVPGVIMVVVAVDAIYRS